jgi:hypothetical protein
MSDSKFEANGSSENLNFPHIFISSPPHYYTTSNTARTCQSISLILCGIFLQDWHCSKKQIQKSLSGVRIQSWSKFLRIQSWSKSRRMDYNTELRRKTDNAELLPRKALKKADHTTSQPGGVWRVNQAYNVSTRRCNYSHMIVICKSVNVVGKPVLTIRFICKPVIHCRRRGVWRPVSMDGRSLMVNVIVGLADRAREHESVAFYDIERDGCCD